MKYAVVFSLALILFCAGCVDQSEPLPEDPIAEKGDTVYVSYVGKFKNDTVFDTSIEEVAIEEGLYDAFRDYGPLEFVLGSGAVISGFDDAVSGMKVGEEKSVLIAPKEAYGMWNPDYVEITSRTQTSPRIEMVSLQVFQENLNQSPYEGMVYHTPPYEWNRTVLNVSDTYVLIRHDPINGSEVDTFLGPAVVGLDEENLYFRINPALGTVIQTIAGAGRITNVSEESFSVDFNHPLAGKSLVFDIKLENLSKGA